MSQVRRQPAIFTANRETAFRTGLTPAGTKLFEDLSPEEWAAFSRPHSIAGRCGTAWRNDTDALHCKTFWRDGARKRCCLWPLEPL